MADYAALIVDAGGVRQVKTGDVVTVPALKVNDQAFPAADGNAGQILKTDGAGNLSWDTKFITTNATFYISTTGSDETGDGSSGNPWATITKAINYLNTQRIPSNVAITIQFADGTYSYSAAQVWKHPDHPTLTIQGTNTYDKTMSSVVSSSGSAGAYSIVIQLNNVTNIAVNDYIVMMSASGGTNPRQMLGCHKVTAVDSGNSRITVTSMNLIGVPSGAVTGTVTVLKSIFYSTVNSSLLILVSGVSLRRMAFVSSVGTNAVIAVAYQGDCYFEEKVGAFNGHIAVSFNARCAFAANACAVSGGIFGFDAYGSATLDFWGNNVATGAAWGGISSRQGSFVYIGGSCQVGGNTLGLLSQARGYIYSIGNIYFGNTTQTSPAINTVGATLEFIYSSGDVFA